MLNFSNNKKVVYHFGRWHGFNAAFARLTDEKVTIIILGNKFTRSIYNSARKSYDLFGNYSGDNDEEEADDEKEATPGPSPLKKSAKTSKSG